MIKNKVDGYAYVNLAQNNNFSKYELISKIAQVACIPQDLIVDIYFYSKIYISERKNYTQSFTNVYFDEFDSLIYNHKLNYYKQKRKIFYVLVDLSKNSVFNNYNNSQLNAENDKKNLQNQVNNLNKTINRLNNINNNNNYRINNLINQTNEMSSQNKILEENITTMENKYEELKSSHENEVKNLNNENKNLKKDLKKKRIRWIGIFVV